MAVLEVLRFPDPRLRKKAKPADPVDKRIRELSADLLETMYAEGGIGLAATQVNVQERIVVIDLSAERNAPLILINPEILTRDGTAESQEGCLSVPGYFDVVERAEQVTYRYQDTEGRWIEQTACGLMAICLQHEIDHLNGRLFIDYLSPLKRQRIRKKIEKQEKQLAVAL
ncbi:MAG: peptide deformylase [Gammaproteobacteria bacterium]|nr:peptide deformylase [Gammaproteobacteria bacterium]